MYRPFMNVAKEIDYRTLARPIEDNEAYGLCLDTYCSALRILNDPSRHPITAEAADHAFQQASDALNAIIDLHGANNHLKVLGEIAALWDVAAEVAEPAENQANSPQIGEVQTFQYCLMRHDDALLAFNALPSDAPESVQELSEASFHQMQSALVATINSFCAQFAARAVQDALKTAAN